MTERSGKCLCGAVRYRFASTEDSIGACHCEMCRRFSGGVFMTIDAVPGSLEITGAQNITVYKSSDWAERGFCKICGAGLFYRVTIPGPYQGVTMMTAGTLDDLSGLPWASEVYNQHNPHSYAFAGARKPSPAPEAMAMVAAASEGASGAEPG
ncbi:MAG: GFA family protein [Pseudomonadota bacterium]